MDVERIFNSETTEYVASEARKTTPCGRFLLTLDHFAKFSVTLLIECLWILWDFVRCYPKRKDLSGQVALVTGGANGLGREICLRLAWEKCKIAVVDINLECAEKTVRDLHEMGAEAKAYKADVADFEAMKRIRQEVLVDFGSVDILVNNAGFLALLTLNRATPEQIERMVAVNVTSVVMITKLFLEDMIRQDRGHIVAISSPFGLSPTSHTMYGMTLYAIRGFMTCLNQELIMKGWQNKIKTTCAFPYYIATRKELTDYTECLNLQGKFVLISPTEAAEAIVKGIQFNMRNLTIPAGFYMPMTVLGIFTPRIIRRFYQLAHGWSSNFP
ncbi:putative oxidoreductase SadH [Phlebotomus argentipes]|uniref:putative oxidoreductase SadH n=1 Tax=Phlebotomus argentipes TaxID=94469 RepID=UPI002893393A|nr:putative oxidoreductase SadH [Phlebotomus argentipes]